MMKHNGPEFMFMYKDHLNPLGLCKLPSSSGGWVFIEMLYHIVVSIVDNLCPCLRLSFGNPLAEYATNKTIPSSFTELNKFIIFPRALPVSRPQHPPGESWSNRNWLAAFEWVGGWRKDKHCSDWLIIYSRCSATTINRHSPELFLSIETSFPFAIPINSALNGCTWCAPLHSPPEVQLSGEEAAGTM